eukprot:TRINITY_DN13147_c0_g1_i1.p1 TRINITY_DN13147_c0_g1~~TRINITY_DN13147_c0_g1_i1.p1  ORF type:complete len:245 (+),score=28.75 TRINITY_DN13147_c0_g1_i1:23-736(+)
MDKLNEGFSLQKLRDFAHKQQIAYLVSLCNLHLEQISHETKINYTNPNCPGMNADTTFKNDMNSLVSNNTYSDVVFVVMSDKSTEISIPGHQALLMSRSDYFKAMFDPSKKLRESQSRIVRLDMHQAVFIGIMSYLYASIVPRTSLNPRFATSLLEAVTQFMIDPLILTCQMYLISHIDRSNVCALFNLADTLNADFLREECLDYTVRNYLDLKKSEELSTLYPSLLEEVKKFFCCI